MKSYLLVFLLVMSRSILFAQDYNQVFHGCGTDELMNNNPQLQNEQAILDDNIYNFITHAPAKRSSGNYQTYTIPVVVHIIHNNGAENISDAQVQAAIAHINAKYARANDDQIQFCLAQRDPSGNATTGITRNVSTLTTETMEYDDISLKNINRWAPTCYLNIWVIKEILSVSAGNGVVGYAYFPSSYGTNVDGLVIEANYFGSNAIYDAVGTHEIGHYFGLYHTFQGGCPNTNCLMQGDHVCDTPPDQTTFASCNPPSNSCSTDADDKTANNPFTTDVNDNGADYMDYSTITCYTNFTPDQYTRMLYFLLNVRYPELSCKSCSSPCPAPVTATITTPATNQSIMTKTSVSFAGTTVNTASYQWYIDPGNILSTASSLSYTFGVMGSYWMKFRAVSSNGTLCNDAIDSVLIEVIEPVIASCSGSLNLDATNSSMRFPSNNQYYSAGGFTWECWFRLNSSLTFANQQLRALINEMDNISCEDIALLFYYYSTAPTYRLMWLVDGPGGCSGLNPVRNDYAPPGGFVVGTWYHVAVSMDYTKHISKMYFNGQLVSSLTNNATPITRVAPTEVGWDAINVKSGYPEPATGANVDEIRLWKTVRSDSDIYNNYLKCMLGNETNLLLYYRCNQTAGSNGVDASINNQNATLYNSAAWSTAQAPLQTANCPASNVVVNSATICPGNQATLKASGSASYSWSPATGLNTTIGATVTASPSSTTLYTVTGSSGCDTSRATTTVTVNTVGTKIPDLGPDISLCTSGTRTLHAGTGFETYTWQDNSTDSIFTAYGPGKYWVTVKNFCSPTYLTDTVNITVTAAPTLDLGADITLCGNDSTLLSYTSNGVFTTFQWTPAAGLSCSTCPNPYAHSASNTTYYLAATTADGCTNADSLNVIHDPLCNSPASHFLASDSTFCDNNCINFTNISTNATSWLWSFPGGQPSSSTDENPQHICYFSSGNYTVTLISYNQSGSDTLTSSNFVKVKSSPVAPTLYIGHDTIYCPGNPAYSYQWYRNNSILTGETDTILIYTQGGNYNVEIRNEDSCSIAVGINIVGLNDPMYDKAVSITFDASNDELYIAGKWRSADCMLSVYTSIGQRILQKELKSRELTTISLNSLAPGIYFAQVRADDRQYVKKIVVR